MKKEPMMMNLAGKICGTQNRALVYFFETLWLPIAGLSLDAMLVTVSFYCAFLLRFHFHPIIKILPPPDIQSFSAYTVLLPLVVPLWLLIFFYSAGMYRDPHINPEDIAVRCMHGVFLSTVVTLATSFLLKQYWHSRLMLVFVAPVAFVLVFIGNVLLRKLQYLIIVYCGLKTRVLVAGSGKVARLASARLKTDRHVCTNCSGSSSPEILRLVQEEGIQHVVLADASLDKTDLLALADALELAGVRFSIMPGMLEMRQGEVQLDSMLGLPLITISHTSLTASNYVTKRLFDIFFSLCVILLGLVPFLVIALLIKLDSPGPVLYRQKRYGYKGEIFSVFKFRTMRVNAEALVQTMHEQKAESGPYFKVKNDSRITTAGKWLRLTSLDEFPQFINVFLGEMSVVGPRPLATSSGEKEALEREYGKDAAKVFNVLPGITGLWQVSGRSDLADEQRFNLDIYYIEHWSLGLDLRVILKTPLVMLSIKGAY
jgi:exopolysaccharide biosynthesis polyprenyl glycosylphosphotransferase